jgi:hypothetical protein
MLIFFHKLISTITNSPARKNKLIIISTVIAIILNIAIWAIIYFLFRPHVINLPEAQSFIPLHYNIYIGADLYGKWYKIFYNPALGLLLMVINTILMAIIYNKKKIISYYLAIVSPIIQLLLLISTALAILINL